MDNWDEIREKRKRQLKRQAVIDKIKNVFAWIIAVIFGIGVAYTFLGDLIGTFFHSTNQEPTYEEHFLDKVP